MIKFAPRLMVLFLCGTALAGCADTDIASLTGGKTEPDHAKAQVAQTTPTDLDSGIRQAQLLRQAEHYDEAVHILSQLMLVASDDARVVGEYGKTLVQMGRAQDATEFLSRAIQLQPNDWTAYSALGVAYDQIGDQVSARMAYEHALALHPGEPSILNNYALSRMLANDPAGAHQLIERAKLAGGEIDPKIARNIAMMNKLAAAPEEPKKVAAAAPSVAPSVTPSAPLVQPKPVVVSQPVTVATLDEVGAPRPLHPQIQSAPQPAGVVMQRVPVDPLAGPAKSNKTAHVPVPAAVKVASKPVTDSKMAVKAASAQAPTVAKIDSKPAATVAKVEVKPATDSKGAVKTDSKPAISATIVAKADSKPVADSKVAAKADTKPVATVAKVEIKPVADNKLAVKTDSKPAVTVAKVEIKPAPDSKLVVKTDAKAAPTVSVAKTEAKPATASKLAAKTDTKPADKAAVKTADAKNGVPALRMAADRY